MINLIAALLFGGYAGCGDCCGRTPKPERCVCNNCIAEKETERSELPTKPIVLERGNIQELAENCSQRGGFLEIKYISSWDIWQIDNVTCVPKVQCSDRRE